MNGMPSWDELVALFRLTLSSPREGAAQVLARRPGRDALWLVFALVVVATVMLDVFLTLATPVPEEGADSPMGLTLPPLTWLVVQAGALWLMVVLIHYVGRALGGQGEFDGALAIACWLELVSLVFVASLIVLSLIMPPLAALGLIVLIVLRLWLLTCFIATLHGFENLGAVLLGIIGVLLAIGFVLFFLMSAAGIEFSVGATA